MERQCGECGTRGMARFDGERDEVRSGAFVEAVEGLSGWRCRNCGEVEFVAESAERFADAGRRVVRRAREADAREFKRIRMKLGLRQADIERLTGGGHNAPSRWERGETPIGPAVMNLMRLLDRDPSRLAELTD